MGRDDVLASTAGLADGGSVREASPGLLDRLGQADAISRLPAVVDCLLARSVEPDYGEEAAPA